MPTNVAVQRVADEVRAHCARRRVTQADLAKGAGKSLTYWARRLRGEVAFDVADLYAIADVLGVSIEALLPAEDAA